MFLDLFPVSFICFPLFSLDTALSLSLSLSLYSHKGFTLLFQVCASFLSFLLSSDKFIFLPIIHIFIIKSIFLFICLFVKRTFFDILLFFLTDIFKSSHFFIFLHFNYIFMFSFFLCYYQSKKQNIPNVWIFCFFLTIFIYRKILPTNLFKILFYFLNFIF